MDNAQPQNPVQEPQQPNIPITPTEPLKPQIPSKTPIVIMIIITAISLALSGHLAYQNYNLNQQIGQLEETPSSPTADPTANWEKYKSDRYKYEFKYPEEIFKGELYIYDDGKHVNITNEVNKKLLELDKDGGFQLHIGIRDDRNELGDYNSDWQKHYGDLGLLKTGQEINNIKKIDELKITGKVSGIFLNEQLSDPQIYTIFTFLENDGSLYEISLGSFNKDLLETKIDLFENIINTFKILNPTDDWEIYINAIEGFSFKYPQTWSIDKKDEMGDERKENIQIKLTKDQATITIYANLVGIGGRGRNFDGENYIFDGNSLYLYRDTFVDSNTQTLGITDRLVGSLGVFKLGDKTYDLKLSYPLTYSQTEASNIETEFKQILSTFKFSQ